MAAAIRKPRADAERNRNRIIEAARSALSENKDVSFEEIGRRAAVGTGTLYRHFPNRAALVEAAYRDEADQLIAAAWKIATLHPPVTALRDWLLLYVDYAAANASTALAEPIIGQSIASGSTSRTFRQAIHMLVDLGKTNGELLVDLDPFDLLRALAAVAKRDSSRIGRDAANRLVDILIAGLRIPLDDQRDNVK